jgi:hypothetical protein
MREPAGRDGCERDRAPLMLRFSCRLIETVIAGRPPTLVRLNRCGGLDTDLARVGYRAVGVEVDRDPHRISRTPGRSPWFSCPYLRAGKLATSA